MHCPEGCLVNESHLWCRNDGDSYLVGITEFAQQSLGEILYVEIPDPAATVGKNQSFGIVESAKVVSELISPISGTISEVNTALQDTPGLLNQEPYDGGWLLRVRIENDESLSGLMNPEEYVTHVTGS